MPTAITVKPDEAKKYKFFPARIERKELTKREQRNAPTVDCGVLESKQTPAPAAAFYSSSSCNSRLQEPKKSGESAPPVGIASAPVVRRVNSTGPPFPWQPTNQQQHRDGGRVYYHDRVEQHQPATFFFRPLGIPSAPVPVDPRRFPCCSPSTPPSHPCLDNKGIRRHPPSTTSITSSTASQTRLVTHLDDRPDHAAAGSSGPHCLENHQLVCNMQHQQGEDLLLTSTSTTTTRPISTSGARNSSNDTVTIRRISNTATDNIINPTRRNRQHQESGYNNCNFSLGEEGLQHQQPRLGPPYTLDRQIKSSIAQLTSAGEFLNYVELGLSSLQDDKNNRVTPPVIEERIKVKPQKEYYKVGGESYRKLEFSHIKCISEIRDLALELLKPVEHMEYKFLENLEGNESTTAQARHQQQHQEVVSRSDGTIRRSLTTNVRKTKYKDVIPTKLNNLRLFNLQECKNFEGCCPCKMRLRDAKRSRFKGGVGNFAEMLPTPIPMNALQKKSKVFHKRKMNSIKETTKILAKDYFFAQQPVKKNVVGEEESILTKGIVHGLVDSRSEGSNVSLPLEDRHWKGMIETIEKAFNFQLVGGRVKREEEDETLDANSNSSNNGKKKRKQITSTNLSIPTKLRKLPIEYTKEFKERRLVPCPCKVSNNGCCLTRNAVKGAAEKADTLFPAVVERQQ
eukprot:scaffold1222_cov260-Chaetoceros_neogracile.AAC.15